MENETKQKQERTVVMLMNKASNEISFYGNLKALFENNEAKELAVSYNYLRNKFVRDNRYENDSYLIYKDVIVTSSRSSKD